MIAQVKSLDDSLKNDLEVIKGQISRRRGQKCKNVGRSQKLRQNEALDVFFFVKLSLKVNPVFFANFFIKTLTKSRMRLNERWDHHFYRISI